MSFFSVRLLDNRFPALHGLRVLAIICVVAFHIYWAGLSPHFIAEKSRLWIGIDFFFVLSGFLIGGMLLHIFESKDICVKLPHFYARRFFRTVPSYYVVYAVMVFLNGLTPFQKENMLKELLFLSNYPYSGSYVMSWGWSLSLEEHFYLLSPIIILGLLKLSDRWRLGALGFFFLLPMVQRCLNPISNGEQFNLLNLTPSHMRYDTFVAGVFLAYIEKYYRREMDLFAKRGWIVPLAGFFGCFLLALAACKHPRFYPTNYQLASIQCGTLTSIGYVLLIFWGIHGQGVIQRFLSAKFIRVCATLGYGVYLVHYPVCEWVNRLVLSYNPHLVSITSFALQLFLGLIFSLGLAYVLHILVEKPSLWLRDRLTTRTQH